MPKSIEALISAYLDVKNLVILNEPLLGSLSEYIGDLETLVELYGDNFRYLDEITRRDVTSDDLSHLERIRSVPFRRSFSGYWSEKVPGQQIQCGLPDPKSGGHVRIMHQFLAAPGGHTVAHMPGFNNDIPPDRTYYPGEVFAYILGPACGEVRHYVLPWKLEMFSRISVGEGTFEHLGASGDYILIGSNSSHPSNHWARPEVNRLIKMIAREYKAATGKPLYFNDMSLCWGGVFDIQGNWGPPHHEHRNGNCIDIAATAKTMTKEAEFKKILRKYTTNYIIEGSGNSRHYHVRF